MALTIVTAPASEPVSLADAKVHLRIPSAVTADDAYITALITVARQWVENYTNRALITQTVDWTMDDWPDLPVKVPMSPLQSITSIKYYDTSDTEATWSSDNYAVDIASTPGRIDLAYGCSLPSTTLRDMNGVVIRFVAGFGTAAANVPPNIIHAIKLMLTHYYEYREPVLSTFRGEALSEVPLSVYSLLANYRVCPM